VLQPFSGFPIQSLKYLERKIHKTFPKSVIKPPIKLPDDALNFAKKRYRADSLIHFLGKRAKINETIIGLTTQDISVTKKGVKKDFGVFGYGLCPGNSCVVSTFRIKGNNKLEKLYKLSIHEIGHTKGLPHCTSTNCFMRDAKGKDHFDELTDFCRKCKLKLS
jgi:archaemetzincin